MGPGRGWGRPQPEPSSCWREGARGAGRGGAAGRGWDTGTGESLSARSWLALGSPGSEQRPFSRLPPSPLPAPRSPPSPPPSALPGRGLQPVAGRNATRTAKPPREEGRRRGQRPRGPKPCARDGPRAEAPTPAPDSPGGRGAGAAEGGEVRLSRGPCPWGP